AALDPAAERFVAEVLHEPVVLFALEWCEFCWSVRKLFAKLGVAYRSVDLDSVQYQEGDMGGKIRAVLAARLGVPTIPQVFVGGEHVGGCTETFDAMRAGDLQARFRRHGVAFDERVDIDPYTL